MSDYQDRSGHRGWHAGWELSLSTRLDKLQDLASEVVEKAQAAGADTAEAVAGDGFHLSTRVRMGKTELVEEAGSRSLGVRVMLGKQVAVTYTSDTSSGGVQRLVEDAVDLARLAQADEYAGPPDPSLLSSADQHVDLDTFDASISRIEAKEALGEALAAEEAALAHDERLTNSEGASFSRVEGGRVLVTSGGFIAGSEGTYASLSVRPIAQQKDGKRHTGSDWTARRHRGQMRSPVEVGAEAAKRTLQKLGAKKVKTQNAPVIFERDAAASILGLFGGSIMGSAIWRKSSYLTERLQTRVASDLITIVDDPLIPRAPGSRAYDGEGLLARKNVVVQKGMLETYLLDSYCGRKLAMPSTASASRRSSGGVGPTTSNFILQPGTTSFESLVADTKAGLIVTEMMGFGFNGVTGDFSRGAAGFWVENGEIAFPVSEVTISLNLNDLLQRIDCVCDDLNLRSSVASPSFRVSEMTIAGS